ncbi:MAG TPA: RagB/SusD family nutrient uptake outer membrane protein, partial [Vicinamibacterales bacterium]|nr:RagB/SusD family nutrient uptake outer membrane protein [Vicinamibacterales bacterium]
AVLGCNALDAPDQNAASLGSLTNNPTAGAVDAAAQGLIIGMRGDYQRQIINDGLFGREAYNLDPGNPQTEIEFYEVLGDLAVWANPYSTIKLADLVYVAAGSVNELTAEQQEGVRGFAQTIKAIELLNTIRSVYLGAALDAASDPAGDLPPVVDRDQVYAGIQALLDSAETHLEAAGTAFSFDLGTGFAGFDTPPTFIKFNRAVRARADIDISDWESALTDLSNSFLDTDAPLSEGVYFPFSTVSGDATNALFEATPRNYYVHPSIISGAQLKPDDTPDNRVQTKIRNVDPVTRYSLSTQWSFTLYNNPSAPVPYLRNEELILLRAEANLGLGNTSEAIADINFIRVNSGGLAPISDPYVPAAGQPATLLDELLYEKRYSLMWEMGSSSWIDARHYGTLANLPHDLPGYVVFPYTRVPDNECFARSDPKPAGCTSPAGL